jgi:hypothetical protein
MMFRRRVCWLLGVGLSTLAMASPLKAQTCEVNNQAACIVAGDATRSLYITVNSASRLIVPEGSIVLPPASVAALQTTFGTPVAVGVTVRSNIAWTVSVSSPAAFWTPVGGTARSDKPRSDLQWSTSAGGTFTNVGATGAALPVPVLPGEVAVPLFFRVRYEFGLDRAGSYQLPVTLTLAAP